MGREPRAQRDGVRNASRATKDEARMANRERYESGEEVARYLQERYHALRLWEIRRSVEVKMPASRGNVPSILELGAGSPMLALLLAEDGYAVTASDIEPAVLESLRCAQLAAVAIDASSSFGASVGKFDCVIAGEVIEHLYDPVFFLKQCRDALRPGGIVVLSTPNLATLQDRWRFMFGRAPRQVDPLHPYLWLHIRPFTVSLLKALGEHTGLSVVRVRSNLVVWRFRKRRASSRALARLAPSLGGSLIVTLQRDGSL